MKLRTWSKPLLAVALLTGLIIAAYATRESWLSLWRHNENPPPTASSPAHTASSTQNKKLLLTDAAIGNLGLVAKPIQPTTYWKTIQVPGMVVDRPGFSDRSVISPVSGVVTAMSFQPGDTVCSGEVLFKVRLLSESLHQTQSDLFKASQDISLATATQQRLAAAKGAIPEVRIIEVDNEIKRLRVAVRAYRQELANRGLTEAQIDGVEEGTFVAEVSIVVPDQARQAQPLVAASSIHVDGEHAAASPPVFEVQECRAELGQQVQAGQTLCLLANHQVLAVEGRAFRDETLLLERSVQAGWPVEIDFQENADATWPPIEQTFHILHIANTIDPANRTFGFRIPLENQSRVVNQHERAQILWRFRPGQRVRVLVRVEKLDNVFVLPSDAVTQELADAFVFTQNVNTFARQPVRVVARDHEHTVVANDGSLLRGMFVVQNAAAQLNRMTKSQADNALPEGYHIHADGSLHRNEDEDH
ncbi:MAG: efflux RND transporter periplasmic adaptor subunit [Pirellulales bacterium]